MIDKKFGCSVAGVVVGLSGGGGWLGLVGLLVCVGLRGEGKGEVSFIF